VVPAVPVSEEPARTMSVLLGAGMPGHGLSSVWSVSPGCGGGTGGTAMHVEELQHQQRNGLTSPMTPSSSQLHHHPARLHQPQHNHHPQHNHPHQHADVTSVTDPTSSSSQHSQSQSQQQHSTPASTTTNIDRLQLNAGIY